MCIFGFLDGRYGKESKKSFRNSLRVLEEVLNKKENKPYYFAWVNATCEREFTEKFRVEVNDIPSVSVYIPSKNLFTNLIGSFDSDNINNLIQKTLNGKVHLNKIQTSDLRLKEIKCSDIKEYNDSFEDDDILNELKEDIKRKRLEEEEEKKRQKINEEFKRKKQEKEAKKNKDKLDL
jgi:hypothetical protein